MADLFLSYAREDRDFVSGLSAALEGAGYSVWWDRRIQSGSAFSTDIERELEAAKAVIVCWSEDGGRSRWVKDEANFAVEANKLLAISLDESLPPIGFRQFHALGLAGWPSDGTRDAFQDLLDAVAAKCAKPAAQKPDTQKPAENQSIAVLPFVNMSPDPDQEYFSDGLAEELINTLMKLPALKVAGRTSSFSYKGKDASLKEIGRELSVAHILEGSVRKAGEKVRVSAQLVNAADGFQLWSSQFDRSLDDIFAIQDEIAKSIAGELSIRLGRSTGPLVRRPTEDDEAYQLFLQGRYVLRQRYGENGGDALLRATSFLEAALEKDPQFARAWSSLSIAHAWMPQYVDVDRNEAFDKAKDYSRKAAELDTTLGEHFAGLGVVHMYLREYQKSLECAQRAVELEPHDATVRRVVGSSSALYGYPERGEAHIAEAIRIDPTSGMELAWAGEYQLMHRNYDAARALSTRAAGLGCNFANRVLSELHLMAGEKEKAAACFRKAMHRGGLIPTDEGVEILTLAFGDASDRARASEMIDQGPTFANQEIPEFIIILLIKLGRYDDAMDLFLNNWTDHEDAILTEIWSPANAAFRRSDAFKRFAAQLGLTKLWRKAGTPKQVDMKSGDDFEWREL